MSVSKEELHRLIDALPASEFFAARRFLEYLRDVGGDEPTSEELAASEKALQDHLAGRDPGESLEKVRRELLGRG